VIIIDRDIYRVLLGAGIALFASLATAILQHFLSLRADKKKMEWETKRKKEESIRNSLLPTNITAIMKDGVIVHAMARTRELHDAYTAESIEKELQYFRDWESKKPKSSGGIQDDKLPVEIDQNK
jgi:hypothetical protein